MGQAISEARLAADEGEVPVGALVVSLSDGSIIASRHNERETSGDPTAHAEILAMRDACALRGDWRLDNCAVIVTLEPCPMCAGAIWASRVPLIVFGAHDPKAGAVGTLYNFSTDPRLNHASKVVAGIRAEECSGLLSDFFAAKR